MAKHWTAKIENVSIISWGRRMALRQVVRAVPELWYSFRDTLTHDEDINEFGSKLKDFVRQQNFRIINEKPVIRNKDDHYIVDVYYTIEW